MEYRRLGRTGLAVSRVSLGTGGPQRMGRTRGATDDDVHALVRHAIEAGVNLFDSAPVYGDSEALLGAALSGRRREGCLLSTKFHPGYEGAAPSPDQLIAGVDASRRRLGTDTIDILQLHSVIPERYDMVINALYPTLEDLRERGAVRFLGITESPGRDPGHATLLQAVPSGLFDVISVAYNLLNQSAEHRLLPLAAEHDVGVIAMTAVRRALADPGLLEERIADAKARGLIAPGAVGDRDPLGWLRSDGRTIPEAAYAFAAGDPVPASILTGTSRVDHLDANIAAVLGPPLPPEHMARLRNVFGHLAEPLAE